jgi:hypothetical protein
MTRTRIASRAIRTLLLCGVANLALAPTPAAATACADLEAAKKATYGFRPSQLTPEAKEAKLRELDAFWARVKARGPDGITCLQSMIAADTIDGYFAMNAAALLARLDCSPAGLAAVELGLSRTDLDEIDIAQYVRLVVGLGREGRDVEMLARRYLRHPNVDTRVAQHGGMLLDRDGGGVIMYGSLPPAVADRHLIAALKLPEPHARATAAKLLAVSLSAPALTALKTFPWKTLPARDQDVIEYFVRRGVRREQAGAATKSRQEILAALARIPNYDDTFWGFAADKEMAASAVRRLKAGDLDALRDARRRSITGVSDEALAEYFAISRIMVGVVNRLDLYKDLRAP